MMIGASRSRSASCFVSLALALALAACGDEPEDEMFGYRCSDAALCPERDGGSAARGQTGGAGGARAGDASLGDAGSGGVGGSGSPGGGAGGASADAGPNGAGGGVANDAGGVTDGGSSDAGLACDTSRATGTLLVIFDESASMNEPFGGSSRLEIAKQGVALAAAALPDSLSLGALFFPTTACVLASMVPGGAVAMIDAAPQISFRAPSAFLAAWESKWSVTSPSGGIGSPLQEAFDRADQALTAASPAPGSTRVVLITDGAAGNCFPDGDGMGGSPSAWPTAPIATRVQDWSAAGYGVYVIALPSGAPVEADAVATASGHAALLPGDADELAGQLVSLADCTP